MPLRTALKLRLVVLVTIFWQNNNCLEHATTRVDGEEVGYVTGVVVEKFLWPAVKQPGNSCQSLLRSLYKLHRLQAISV